MRIAIIAATIIFSTTLALAQNTGTGAATSAGDAAISPAAGNPVNDGSTSRQTLGAGIASGAVNNGTTGDTIAAGHGTSTAPATSQGSASSAIGSRKE